MSIDTCKCGKHVDTDFSPEFYREEYNFDGMCDSCFACRQKEEPVEWCRRCYAWTPTIDEGETCQQCKLVHGVEI